MSLVIDTSVLISLEQGDKVTIRSLENLKKIHIAPPSITFINYFEFFHGIRERNPKNKSDAFSFVELFEVLDTTKKTAIVLSDLKYKYEKSGKSFSLSDLLIASQTIENGMTLVTGDKHFQEIEELKKIIL